MAISGLAGKWAAMGEEAKNQIKDYTQFSTRKARVTEVSRALRQAAREEYERRKQERREHIATEKAERSKPKEQTTPEGSKATSPGSGSKPATPGSPPTATGQGEESGTSSLWSPGKQSSSSSLWRGMAVDKGRQARTSILGLMDMVKTKNRPRSKDDEPGP
jgi:hypothetical protein